MYANTNFKTKKALKEAVKVKGLTRHDFYQPNADLTGAAPIPPLNGVAYVEGPHYPEPHRWYATVTFEDGKAVKVA